MSLCLGLEFLGFKILTGTKKIWTKTNINKSRTGKNSNLDQDITPKLNTKSNSIVRGCYSSLLKEKISLRYNYEKK